MSDRSLTILGKMGDLELSWEAENDEKVRVLIEKKMKEGVTFFYLKPVVGDFVHMRTKLAKMGDLKSRSVKVKDADIEALLDAGDASLFRSPGAVTSGEMIRVRDAEGKLDHAAASKIAVKKRTVAVPALQGG